MTDIDTDMEMEMELEDMSVSSPTVQSPSQHDQPVKVRKKPGRKPNPASPALRKAQNRAAQRAFRERKERHMRELEVAIKQIREQRDKLFLENEQLKADAEINRSENWYLKGIVLTLQLVCYQHNLAIPQHGPFVNEQALSVMAQSTPEPIAAYLNVNANSKLPTPTQLSGYRHSIKQRDRYLSVGSIVVTKDDVCQQQFPPLQAYEHPLQSYRQSEIGFSSQSSLSRSPEATSDRTVHPLHISSGSSASVSGQQRHQRQGDEITAMPALSPMEQPIMDQVMATPPTPPTPSIPRPPSNEPITSNLAAIQTLRLRLRLQSACARMDSVPFSIQPSILQLTIPHDPRIDLVPTPHMRDRMILFREQFDLDDCFKCLLSHSVFHGGDPAIAANWQLPKVFFEKYWFLTIDYTLRRTTNRWRRLQGLNELENDLTKTDRSVLVNPLTDKSDHDHGSNDAHHKQKQREEDEKETSNASVSSVSASSVAALSPSWKDSETVSSADSTALAGIPALENQHPLARQSSLTAPMEPSFGIADLSSYLGVEFSKLEQIQQQQQQQQQQHQHQQEQHQQFQHQHQLHSANSLSSDQSNHSTPLNIPKSPLQHTLSSQHFHHDNDSFEPVRLTNGYLLPQKPKSLVSTITSGMHLSSMTGTPPSATPPADLFSSPPTQHYLQQQRQQPDKMSVQHGQDPWDNLLLEANHPGYDLLVNSFLHSDPHAS